MDRIEHLWTGGASATRNSGVWCGVAYSVHDSNAGAVVIVSQVSYERKKDGVGSWVVFY
jgi:hypothetical protein